MKKSYIFLMGIVSSLTFAQQTISFEASEGFQLGTLNLQNNWEVTEHSTGFIQNQVVSNEKASHGAYSFKNAFEPDYDWQWFPIFGASKTFDAPLDHTALTISYDVLVTESNGSDFEFNLFAIDDEQEFVPVAGVGIEFTGKIYLIKDINYNYDLAEAEWTPNQWVNIKIEISAAEIKYYVNNVLEKTIANYTQLDAIGFNMLHNNFGGDAYYDNFVITTGSLSTEPFQKEMISVYPNPSKDQVSLALPGNPEITEVVLYNLTGQEVLKTSQTQNINISGLEAGTYFLKAATENGASVVKKIIKN